jgi:DNA-binding NtrC family response regulator
LDSDLFFVVKVTDTLKHAGYTTHAVRNEHDFAQALQTRRPAVALVNTATRGVDYARALAAAREAAVPSVAYGPHVDLDTQAAARAAGATVVVTNSRLAGDLPGIVTRALRRAEESAPPDAGPADDEDTAHTPDPDR